MSTREIRIATRKSALALWQAEHVRDVEPGEMLIIDKNGNLALLNGASVTASYFVATSTTATSTWVVLAAADRKSVV